MGGDNAPFEIVKGALEAREQLGVQILLAGDSAKIKQAAQQCGGQISPDEILHADDAVSMEDSPSAVLHEHGQSSLVLAMRALAEGKGDAVVSAGNTGAVLVSATLVVKRIHGIKRAAIAGVMPSFAFGSTRSVRNALIDAPPNPFR